MHTSVQTPPQFGIPFPQENIAQYFNNSRSLKTFLHSLDTLRKKHFDNQASVTTLFQRDVDFGFIHTRIRVQCNSNPQIDLVSIGDSIILAAVITRGTYRSDNLQTVSNSPLMKSYFQQRQKLYGKSFSASEVVHEMQNEVVYAISCGIGNSFTPGYKTVLNWANEANTDALYNQLTSFSCEKQAFAVAGFELLLKKGHALKPNVRRIISHIKKRNAPLVTCSGCIMGIVASIY